MIINDIIYGKFEITEPVIVEIINSQSFQRLKNICMAGYYPAYKEINPIITNRYNHSIGVMILLKKYGACIEEQIAGLIHDLSHSAFSHVMDYLDDRENEQKTQNGQDRIHNEFVKKSDVAEILKKYNIDINYILNDENFSLKENNTPDICADRIDYSLRDLFNTFHMINREQLNIILDCLMVYNGNFVFKDLDGAELFANMFLELDKLHYSGLKSAVMLGIGGKFFQLAVKNEYLKVEDFYNYGDDEIIEILNKHLNNDIELKKYYDLLNRPAEDFTNNKYNYIRHVFCKSRFIDPKFLKNGKVEGRVSDFCEKFRNKIKNKQKFNEYYVALK